MSKVLTTLLVILGIIGFIAMYLIGIYNNLVSLEGQVSQQWAQVETQYQRRADLIPNLQATVEGASNFEKDTYTAVTEARAKVNQINLTSDMLSDPAAFQKFQSAQDGLSSALSRLMVTVENYPQLKATVAYQDFMTSLEGTENRISVARKDYNDATTTFNITVKSFPNVMIAPIFGFKEKSLFKSDEGASSAPKVDFNNK